jgi:hypothetical protein
MIDSRQKWLLAAAYALRNGWLAATQDRFQWASLWPISVPARALEPTFLSLFSAPLPLRGT